MDIFDFTLSEEDMKGLTNHGKRHSQNTGWNPTENSREQFGSL